MTTAESKPTKVTATDGNAASAGLLLEHIATASLLEEKFNGSSDAEDESDEEVFEDGDANDHSNREEEGDDHEEFGDARDRDRHESVAAVLTELSQATTPVARNTNGSSTTPSPAAFPLPSKPIPNPSMSATINTINAYLQSHLLSVPSAGQPQKARLYGPIRANVNIRHGVWAPRLRCRKRKNLHAKDGIWINPTCTLDHLIYLVKSVLPDEFEWDSQASPLRYQAVNDQSLQSLKTVSGTVTSGQSLFSAFDLVRNRRSDGDNFILQLYVYGTWTVLLKPHNYQSTGVLGTSGGLDEDMMNSVSLPPPPKKKYQQAHYNQQQMQQMQQMNIVSSEESNLNGAAHNSGMFHMRLSPPSNAAAITSSSSSSHYTHPLSANPPVTFLPTVTLEMKMNGIFVPVEISRRSFVSAIRACSLPKPNNVGVGGSVVNDASAAAVAAVASNSSTISGVSSGIPPSPPPPQTNNANPNANNNVNNNANNNNNTNTINITPPPSEV
jgi:hypothetical protein